MVEFRFIGSIGWTLDSSGNPTARDTSGNIVAKLLGGAFSQASNRVKANANGQVTTTASLTAVSSGIGVTITPQIGGILVTFIGSLANNTASDGCNVQIYRKTGSTVPSGGTAVGTDTAIGIVIGMANNASTAAATFPVTVEAFDSTPVAGTAYTYYAAFNATIGGTATFTTGANGMLAQEI